MTKPAAIDASKYRRVKYLGGRILQARELELMQALDKDVPNKGKYEIGAIYQPGTLLNVRFNINAATVSLLPVDTAKPMLVFVNGAFEAFTAPPRLFTARPAGQTDKLYVNYVLWRVTSNGENATLADAALVDASTLEPTAEMGQIQRLPWDRTITVLCTFIKMLDKIIKHAFRWVAAYPLRVFGFMSGRLVDFVGFLDCRGQIDAGEEY